MFIDQLVECCFHAVTAWTCASAASILLFTILLPRQRSMLAQQMTLAIAPACLWPFCPFSAPQDQFQIYSFSVLLWNFSLSSLLHCLSLWQITGKQAHWLDPRFSSVVSKPVCYIPPRRFALFLSGKFRDRQLGATLSLFCLTSCWCIFCFPFATISSKGSWDPALLSSLGSWVPSSCLASGTTLLVCVAPTDIYRE